MSVEDVLALPVESFRGLRVSEYDALVEAGLFDDERVELLEGALVRVSPQSPGHAEATSRLADSLQSQLPGGWLLRTQFPLTLGDLSEPEPDVAVVPAGDYSRSHPSTATLVIEVARRSRRVDLGLKGRVYAVAGIGEYWVLDLLDRVLRVHTDPGPDGYRDVTVHADTVSTVGEPRLVLDVTAVLPTV